MLVAGNEPAYCCHTDCMVFDEFFFDEFESYEIFMLLRITVLLVMMQERLIKASFGYIEAKHICDIGS